MAVQAENGRGGVGGHHPGGQNNQLTAASPPGPTKADPAKLLDLGPQYLRNRFISMEPGMKRRNRRSAVELLEESKSLYVKSESVLDAKQVPKNADNLQVRQRRSTYGCQNVLEGGSRLSELWPKPDSGSSEASGPGQGSSGYHWTGTAEESQSNSSSSSSGSSSSGQPTPTAETPATALGIGIGVVDGGTGLLTGTSRLDQCHNITSSNTTGATATIAPPNGTQSLLVNNRQPVRQEAGETSGNNHTKDTPPPAGGNSAVVVASQDSERNNKGLKRANSQNCPKCLHLSGKPCEDCCKKRNKVPVVGGATNTSVITSGESLRNGGTTPTSSSTSSSSASRPPPPVPPKPLDHQPLQGFQPGSRQPPPVPPKHRSLSASSETAGSHTGSNTPPPVPPKPGDRNSFHQEKLPPPPVLPKPSNPGGNSASQTVTPPPPVAPKRASYNDMEGNPSTDGRNKLSMEASHPLTQSTPPPVPPKPKPSLMASEAWRDAHTDTSSEIDQHSNSSLVKVDDKLVVVRRRPRKFHRSRSDLTKRFSNSSDLSELSARFSRNSADLEKFFNEMGLDRSVLEPMMMNACQRSASDLHLFESASSIESPDIRSWCSDDDVENTLKHEVVEERTPPVGQSSIVERNARIIKWLCSVKKAASHEEPLTEQ